MLSGADRDEGDLVAGVAADAGEARLVGGNWLQEPRLEYVDADLAWTTRDIRFYAPRPCVRDLQALGPEFRDAPPAAPAAAQATGSVPCP